MKASRAATGVLMAAMALAACEPVQRAADAPDPTEHADASGAGIPARPDVGRGELLSLACQACHSLDAGGEHRVGPNLHGVFGRRAASSSGFDYSPALRATELVWTPQALDAWLADPAGFVPGTTMAFTGYGSARDRRDLVAFLVKATSPQSEAAP